MIKSELIKQAARAVEKKAIVDPMLTYGLAGAGIGAGGGMLANYAMGRDRKKELQDILLGAGIGGGLGAGAGYLQYLPARNLLSEADDIRSGGTSVLSKIRSGLELAGGARKLPQNQRQFMGERLP